MAFVTQVLEMVLEAVLIIEGTEADVAEDVMSRGGHAVISQPVPVLEDAPAQVAVVLVSCILFHVVLQCDFAREFD